MGKSSKSPSTYTPPNNGSSNNLTPAVSTTSTVNISDLKREKSTSSSGFTPTPVISGPIPPLPQRTHHQQQQKLSTKSSASNLRDRRPPSREASGGSTHSHKFNPFNTDSSNVKSTISSPIPNFSEFSSASPQSPTFSVSSTFSPTSTSHMSTQSASTAATHITPRGSVSSARSHEVPASTINQHISYPINPSVRSSLYSTAEEGTGATKPSKPSEFHLERPADDAVIEQMFNDLIVSSLFPSFA